ncbi:hypothetical protein Tco_0216674 [Tanacetum coccineum]
MKRKSHPSQSSGNENERFLKVSYNQLLKATDGFSKTNLIGEEGGSALIYKGKYHDSNDDENSLRQSSISSNSEDLTKKFLAGICEGQGGNNSTQSGHLTYHNSAVKQRLFTGDTRKYRAALKPSNILATSRRTGVSNVGGQLELGLSSRLYGEVESNCDKEPTCLSVV